MKMDVNAGPMMLGLSPSATVYAIGIANYFGDWEFRNKLLQTADIAGGRVKEKDKRRHYKLGEWAIVD